MKEQLRTVQNTKNSTATVQTKSGRLSKSHSDYWSSRLVKRTYQDRNGAAVKLPDWHVRLWKGNRQAWFNLGTANASVAARKAREIYVFIEANGWEAAITKFKPGKETQDESATLGAFLDAVRSTGKLKIRTFLNYQNCLRTIVSEMFGVKGGDDRFDYRLGGNQRWVNRINSIRLDRLTSMRVSQWQKKRVKKTGDSPVAIASARRTVNTYVRCARSLFSKQIQKEISGIKLPAVLPFDGVELLENGSTKYISKIQVQPLIAAARSELKESDPEAYKAFLLGLFAGMRRGEIDLLEWRMIDWENCLIKLEETEWLHLKSNDSAGEITVDAEVFSELRGLMGTGPGKFVLKCDRPPRNDSARAYYRCKPIFDRLTSWLRAKGVSTNKPLHEMRKEIGAMIATNQGIFAASRFLRHADITTTARHYAEHKSRISVGLGKLLQTEVKAA